MIDYVIVTLMFEKQNSKIDMELPARIKADELEQRLLEALKETNPTSFEGVEKINLYYNGERLKKDETLLEQSIWDGKILMVRESYE